MNNFKILTYLLLFLPFIIFGQNNTGAIRIFVQKKQTREPIIDSLVVSVSNATTTTYKVFPNSDGEKYIKPLEPGKYNVSVSTHGYLIQEMTNVIVGHARTAYVVFRLKAVEEAKNKSRRRNKKVGCVRLLTASRIYFRFFVLHTQKDNLGSVKIIPVCKATNIFIM